MGPRGRLHCDNWCPTTTTTDPPEAGRPFWSLLFLRRSVQLPLGTRHRLSPFPPRCSWSWVTALSPPSTRHSTCTSVGPTKHPRVLHPPRRIPPNLQNPRLPRLSQTSAPPHPHERQPTARVACTNSRAAKQRGRHAVRHAAELRQCPPHECAQVLLLLRGPLSDLGQGAAARPAVPLGYP